MGKPRLSKKEKKKPAPKKSGDKKRLKAFREIKRLMDQESLTVAFFCSNCQRAHVFFNGDHA